MLHSWPPAGLSGKCDAWGLFAHSYGVNVHRESFQVAVMTSPTSEFQ